MTVTVPAGTRIIVQNELGELGERLIRFGQALKNPDTTVKELAGLASSCGVALRLRMVAESGDRDDE